MKSTNRIRALIVSGAIILLCITTIIGMTVALFSDNEVIRNHLKAGDLDITLVRTKLTSTYLTNRGELSTITDSKEKDFTNSTSENIFALEGAVIVPQSKYIAEMKVINNSDVDFAYWIEIIYTGESDVELSEQLGITVNNDGTQLLSKGLKVGSEDEPVAVLKVGEFDEFSVTVEFLDLPSAVNNAAQGDDVTFDLVVHAVQYVEADKG